MRINCFSLGCLLIVALGFSSPGWAQQSWTVEQVSPAIHTRGEPVVVSYVPPRPMPPGMAVLRIHVQHAAHTRLPVQTRVCADARGQNCMQVNGASATTSRFYGVPANQPFHLIHLVPGQGAVAPDIYVRASVTVWYEQGALLSPRS